jgi:hypothetical protein
MYRSKWSKRYSLPLVPEVDTPGDFRYQQGCKSGGSFLLVDAQKVDFCHFYFVLLDHNRYRHTGNRAHQYLVLISDANQPFGAVPGRSERPLEEAPGIVEPVCVVVVLNVVICEEVV